MQIDTVVLCDRKSRSRTALVDCRDPFWFQCRGGENGVGFFPITFKFDCAFALCVETVSKSVFFVQWFMRTKREVLFAHKKKSGQIKKFKHRNTVKKSKRAEFSVDCSKQS
eukprot:m.177371 g.177371  ORF g.177371 m.177371 type:complete len:111 (-) comp31886_c1_seq1:1784-2116(-)